MEHKECAAEQYLAPDRLQLVSYEACAVNRWLCDLVGRQVKAGVRPGENGVHMTKVKWLLSILAFTLFAYDSAFACSCIGPADAKEGLVQAKAVFSGKVIAVDDANFTFKIERIWKGVTENKVVVRDYHAGTSCAFNFKLGEQYVVFATRTDYEGKTILIGEVCNWTSRLAEAKEILKAIGKGKPVKGIKNRSKVRSNVYVFAPPRRA